MHRRRSPLPVRYPWQIGWFSNQGAGKLRELLSSATMADQAGLKPVGVDMSFGLGISISKNCKICQVFLFLRPAQSFSGSRISASVYSRPDGGMDPL